MITACPNGYFGLDCREKCSTYCSGNGSCSHITGVCDNGCKDGWSGPKCGTRMNAGMSTTVKFEILRVLSVVTIVADRSIRNCVQGIETGQRKSRLSCFENIIFFHIRYHK